MNRRRATIAVGLICCALGINATTSSAAAPGWTLAITPLPANFAPGQESEYAVIATNVGAAPTSGGVIEVATTIPEGLTLGATNAHVNDPNASSQPECKATGPGERTLTCTVSTPIDPGYLIRVKAGVKVPPGAPEATPIAKATVSGGGGAAVSATAPTAIQKAPVPFDFLEGFNAPAIEEEAAAQSLAGAHPYQQTISFGFPTKNPGDGLTNDGHPRDIYIELPRGMSGSLAASEVLCTEVELLAKACPDTSQVGLTDITTLGGDVGISDIFTSNVYNMVPPPGSAAEFATNVANIGVFVHVLAGLRSEEDYGVQAATRDVIAFGQQPIFGVQAQVWGSPTAPAHDAIRGTCGEEKGKTCPAEPQRDTAFLTTPAECGAPSLFSVLADTWEEPAPPYGPFGLYRASYESADLGGNEKPLEGCSELEFAPTIAARPTTDLTDSPSGLDFTLRQPQHTAFASRATAPLRDAAIHLAAGLAVNPAQAAGLGACTQAQIGFAGKDGEGALHFTEAPQSCPDAAKIGTVVATSPILPSRDQDHKIEEKEGQPALEALHGSIYVAKPFENPFGSFIATYLAIEDKQTGILAKLAGEGQLDPHTGQISVYFKENPEQPVQDIKAHLFGGDRGALITPPTCAAAATEAQLVPWSAPEGKDAFPSTAFAPAQSPRGGCPASEAELPNTPKLLAGAESPAAAKYSPLLFKVSREDATQRLARIEATLPKGLTAKLAGVPACPEQAIAKARAREVSGGGAAEAADPSCPAAAQIATVIAAAGAGPTPYYTSGRAYLAGPYGGAPLSFVAIVPAVAGPFDLGAVVSRIAARIDPETGQARAVSDPLPQIIEGVPLDLRSVALRADRPNFTLNPSSCSEKSIAAAATSALGAVAPLSQRFQVGGCKSLPYKPKLSIRLYGPIHRGGHPRLRSVFTARPGEANTARISVALPKSEFIDQAHFRTICTRVQFAAKQCPPGSIYGHIKATSPLVDYPVQGPIYLRSSSHKLPDVVAALRGPPSQPIEIDLDGRVDSVGGGIRTTFEAVPDLAVSKAIVTLQGGKKGLFQNSTNICKGVHRATLLLDGQNGKAADSAPLVGAQCKGKGKGKGGKGKGGKARR
jgi:hypothetical protein